MSDIDDFDLDRSTAQAWAEFQSRLSEVISMIDDSADLTIGTESEGDGPPPFVRLSSPRRDVIRCEAASNAVLGDDFQLSSELLARMEQLGWQPPTVGGEHSSAVEVTRPTTNFWVELPQVESDRISELAVSALRDVTASSTRSFWLRPARRSAPPSSTTNRAWRFGHGRGAGAGPTLRRPCHVTSST